eukprot:10311427-Alexandrium_andersonii.AAC.1
MVSVTRAQCAHVCPSISCSSSEPSPDGRRQLGAALGGWGLDGCSTAAVNARARGPRAGRKGGPLLAK